MPIYPGIGERVEYYLPLVGGAEMNRLARKKDPVYTYLTSTPYPYMHGDVMNLINPVAYSGRLMQMPLDFAEITTPAVISGSIFTPLHTYGMRVEEMAMGTPTVLGGNLRAIYRKYSIPVEYMEMARPTVVSGSIKQILIRYTNWTVEKMTLTRPTVIGGTLT